MTRVSFFHGANDRIQAACAWITARPKPAEKLLVYAPDPVLAERLDRQLWIQPPTGFVPHCRAASPLAGETPIVIVDRIDPAQATPCLLNLSNDVPNGFASFDELIEIVSSDDAVRLPARERFKFYRERGYDLLNKDVSGGF